MNAKMEALMTRPKILLVDAADDTREAMQHSLENEGLEVVAVRNSKEAIGAIIMQPFDVLITDLSLRRERGSLTEVTTMHHLQPEARNIVLSHAGDIQAAMAVLLKVDEVVVRPFNVKRVVELVRSKTPGRTSNAVTQRPPRVERFA
jgi:DNA-binding NtrC family response regulator